MYINDDYFFNQPISMDDLFSTREDNLYIPRLFLNGNVFKPKRHPSQRGSIWQEGIDFTLRAAKYRKRFMMLEHSPYLFYKECFQDMHQHFSKIYQEMYQHRSRNRRDLNQPFLHAAFCLQHSEKYPLCKTVQDPKHLFINAKGESSESYLEKIKSKPEVKFLCINDACKEDHQASTITELINWLFTGKSEFEKENFT
jgi:hypothetical protein